MTLRAIRDVADDLRLDPADWSDRGRGVAKVSSAVAKRPPRGRFVLVTATTPTTHGEGKTVTTIGLADALRRRGMRAAATLRQPSLGPLFGTKGGATGGGRATVEPAQRIDLHFTGDLHAVAAAQDLVAAMTDASIHHGNPLEIDPTRPLLPRCLDVNDRELRHVVTGLGGHADGTPREAEFVITAASETMAILCLATSHADLKARLGRMLVGVARAGGPVTAADVGAHKAAAALLADALQPNLVQTAEGTPALVHGGPFANVSHGHNSILADRVALTGCDVVVSESGFGADLGAEKYVDLVMPAGGARPEAAVLVTSLRALGEQGEANLDAHLRILRALGIPAIVALNGFPGDDAARAHALLRRCEVAGTPAVAHTAFRDGGEGALDLADAVISSLAKRQAAPAPLYAAEAPLPQKLAAIATRVYGATSVEIEPAAARALDDVTRMGFESLPVCVAKSPYSLTGDERGGTTLRIRDLRVDAGAGYVVALAGKPLLMPGLGAKPHALDVDVDDEGVVTGL
jgi:formate--tetrahydrofolate ligase